MYVLGIHGRSDLIKQPRDQAACRMDDSDGCPSIAAAADVAGGICGWWLRLPPHMQPGAHLSI